MKNRLWFMFCCLSLTTSVFAVNHLHLQESAKNSANVSKMVTYPGVCEIEIVNESNLNLVVSGNFMDGTQLTPFHFPFYDSLHYISLYYGGKCYRGMYIYINTLTGHPIFSGYVLTHHTVYVLPFSREAKVEITPK